MMKVNKPWGHELIWAKTDKYIGKILYINKGNRLSLQYHEKKEETIMILEGMMELVNGVGSDNEYYDSVVLISGDTYHIPPLTVHRFCANQGTDVKLIEVSTPELDDVIRIEDDYSRK